MHPVLIITVAVIVVLLFFIITVYNRCITARNRVKNQWAQIDVQLTRRADLVPNLVESVKGAVRHERDTLMEVMQARSNFYTSRSNGPEREIKSSDALSSALSRLMAVAESYPELRANQNFLLLKQELSDTETKISHSRMFYNDTVMKYNNIIQVFPTNIVAGMMGFGSEPFFEADVMARTVPKVGF